MRSWYQVLQTSLREAANDNLGVDATLKLIIRDLDIGDLNIVPRWQAVDYSQPIAVIDDALKATHTACVVNYAGSVGELDGKPGHLVCWEASGRAQAGWFDDNGRGFRRFQVVNVAPPVPVPVAVACGHDQRGRAG
jgi:hypothetical protein